MKTKILYIERKAGSGVSIEKVFRQIAKKLSKEKFEFSFQQLTYTNDALGTLKNLLFYRKPESDIYHVTGHVHYITLILPKEKTVLTIHDLGILNIRKGIRRFILKKLLFDLPVKRLNYITAVSEFTKNEILYYTKCDKNKIRVIENPLQEDFFAANKKKFNTVCPNILQIGTTKNKNLSNLIKALNGIECKLIIVGKMEVEIKKLLEKYKINYVNKLNLDNKQIKSEYENADIVTFCSTFEGFGLPIIESQAMRTPVVAGNISPLKEVAGAGAVLVDPYDYMDIRKGILSVIKDENLRDFLIEKGLENVKRFEPEYISRLYEKLYEEVINSNKK